MEKIRPIQNKNASLTAPPSKAHTLRSLLLASLAEGASEIHQPLLGEDQKSLIACLKNLGISIEQQGDSLTVKGCGGKFTPVNRVLDCGESGVSMNALSALSCLVEGPITLTGAPGLLARPVEEVVKGLRQWGADIEYQDKEGFPPLVVKSGSLKGGISRMSGAKNSQYFSALSMMGPYSLEKAFLHCTDEMTEKPYYDITEEMMSLFGGSLENRDYREIAIEQKTYQARDVQVEGDFSSACFFLVAAAISQSRVTIGNLNPQSRQGDRKIVDYLKAMGCHCSWKGRSLSIEGKALKAIETSMMDTPDMLPSLAIAAACAEGTSVFKDVGHLRFKECDRLEAIIQELAKMGIRAWFQNNSLYVEGNKSALRGASIHCYNDHRIAMSFAIAGLVVEGQIIEDEKCVAKSFPDFWERFEVFF